MKRMALSFILLVMGFLLAMVQPALVTTTSVLVFAVCLLVVLCISLILNPVTTYVNKTELLREIVAPNNFRYGINAYRDVFAEFTLASGRVISGTLIGRNDGAGTFTIQTEQDEYQTITQADLKQITSVGNDTPESMKIWDDTSPLLVPRNC